MSGQELVAGRAGGGPPPWRWVICDRNDPDDRAAVRASGVQHTRLYASAGEVAAERIAELAYRAWRADRIETVGPLVCWVKRDGAERWEGKAAGSVWIRRTATARRQLTNSKRPASPTNGESPAGRPGFHTRRDVHPMLAAPHGSE